MALQLTQNLLNVKDGAGLKADTLTGRSFSPVNQMFTLTAGVVTVVTVSLAQKQTLLAHFKYRFDSTATAQGGEPDVWVSPVSTPVLALPTGVVTEFIGELNPDMRLVSIEQELQFLTSQVGVVVGISYVIPLIL